MFTLAFIADNISLTRHKICNFPLPIWEAGREQVWLMTIILQSSAEAREKVEAVPEGGSVNSPGFEPILLGSDPASTTYSGLLSNSVWASVYSSANCGLYHLFIGLMYQLDRAYEKWNRGGMWWVKVAVLQFHAELAAVDQTLALPVPRVSSVSLKSVLNAVGRAAYIKCLGLQREILENLLSVFFVKIRHNSCERN